jgi:hypothetical protein
MAVPSFGCRKPFLLLRGLANWLCSSPRTKQTTDLNELLQQCDKNALVGVVKHLYVVLEEYKDDPEANAELDREKVKEIVREALNKMELAGKRQQGKRQNTFARQMSRHSSLGSLTHEAPVALLAIAQMLGRDSAKLARLDRRCRSDAPGIVGISFLELGDSLGTELTVDFPETKSYWDAYREKGRDECKKLKKHFFSRFHSGLVHSALHESGTAGKGALCVIDREWHGSNFAQGAKTTSTHDADFLDSLPAAAASRIRFLNMAFACNMNMVGRKEGGPPAPIPDFGAKFSRLLELHITLTATACTLPDDRNCLATPLVQLVRHTGGTLRELDVKAGIYFEFSHCVELVNAVGPALEKFRLHHHLHTRQLLVSLATCCLDRSKTLRAELANVRPDLNVEDVEVHDQVECYITVPIADLIMHLNEHGRVPRANVVAGEYEYGLENRPSGAALPHHRHLWQRGGS